jgi:hypothetical protein
MWERLSARSIHQTTVKRNLARRRLERASRLRDGGLLYDLFRPVGAKRILWGVIPGVARETRRGQ